MEKSLIKSELNESSDEVIYNEYYIKDIKSKIKKFIEIGDDNFIRAFKSLLRSDTDDDQA